MRQLFAKQRGTEAQATQGKETLPLSPAKE